MKTKVINVNNKIKRLENKVKDLEEENLKLLQQKRDLTVDEMIILLKKGKKISTGQKRIGIEIEKVL